MRKIRLFCIPYAGGSATVYNSWSDHLDRSIQLVPVEPAGRGKRIHEPFYQSVEEAAEDIVRIIKHQLFDAPFAFYGHSMGGAIVYRAVQRLKEKNYPLPVHVFFSGRGAPHVKRKDKEPYHTLSEPEFRQKVLDLGGTPQEFFQHPQLLEILMPLLRADFKISWLFGQHFNDVIPMDCDISILTGKEEDLNQEQIDQWTLHTNGNCRFYSFEGGHFFINDPEEKKKIFSLLNRTLKIGRHMESPSPVERIPQLVSPSRASLY